MEGAFLSNPNTMKDFKKAICKQLLAMLEVRSAESKQLLASIKESRDGETKSSAGDKYETSRAMTQNEMEKCEVQLDHIRMLQHELSRIDLDKTYSTAETGSLVITGEGRYFISVGIGKVIVANVSVYVISAVSPLGRFLSGKSPGDTGTFQGKEFRVLSVV
jgi:hypothetical protein